MRSNNKMWLARVGFGFFLINLAYCDGGSSENAANDLLDAAKSLFNDKESLQNVGKQMGEMFGGKNNNGIEHIGDVLSGLGSLMSGDKTNPGIDFSMLSSVLESFASSDGGGGGGGNNKRSEGTHKESKREIDTNGGEGGGFDFGKILAIMGNIDGKNENFDTILGLIPMVLNTFLGKDNNGESIKPHDHSGHAWYMPPILEYIHVMWDHFRYSELGQTLWKNSGLANIVGQMTDPNGNIEYERILDSFENPSLRRRWIKSMTNFVAEWISRISDPMIQQRYLATAQFVGNSFLKAQGLPKAAMFDSSKPTESITRLCNVVAAKHLGMKIDCSQYVRPAVTYIQELMNLASSSGFIMSRINAMELSNKLSDTINNDFVAPILKAYRAYKWSLKAPHCANQILCTINEKRQDEVDNSIPEVRRILTKIASFPVSYFLSIKTDLKFWTLYGAIGEQTDCVRKYPQDCVDFHEEEIRVTTTEHVHNEL